MQINNIIRPIDRSLKILAREYPKEVVKFILQDIPLIDVVTIKDSKLNIPEKQVDFVYLVNNAYILHTEFQLVHEPDIPLRMIKYNAFLLEIFNKPVIPVVIYLEKHDYQELPNCYTVKIEGKKYAEFTYIVIKLWDYIEEIRAGKWKWLLPLLILLEEEKKEETLLREKELILQEKNKYMRANLLSLAITIASRYFEKKFLFDFFKEEMNMLKSASIVEEWIKEGYESGMEKGIEKGIEKGMEKGMEKGTIQTKQNDLIHILETRFKKIPDDIYTKVKTITEIKQLDKLLSKSVLVKNINEFAKFIKKF